jgi:hypothetical protein
MVEAKTVRLDEDVLTTLAEKRQDWEIPNQCLKRLLQQRDCVDSNKTKSAVTTTAAVSMDEGEQ